MMSRIFAIALLAFTLALLVSAAPQPEAEPVMERGLDDIVSQVTGGAASVLSRATDGAASIVTQATGAVPGIITTVISGAQGAATVVTSAGGAAITLAGSGAGKVTQFAGQEYTAVTGHATRVSIDGVPIFASFFVMVIGAVGGALLTL